MKGINSGLDTAVKHRHMDMLADYRENTLRKHPELRSLFFELTPRCNLRCRHCGSRCGEEGGIGGNPDSSELSVSEYRRILDEVKEDFDISGMRLCVTGGEPLLYPGFFEVMDYANRLGYRWGMTSNGTLIDAECARKLRRCGMRTISVSLDGLKEDHDWFRQCPGSYDRAVRGIGNLLSTGGFSHIQITTVVYHRNIGTLPRMYEEFRKLGVRSWRVINIEPIGRAKDDPELLLNKEELRTLIGFIRDRRFSSGMEVIYGCSHYLGDEYEREVRKWYFLCNAGVYTASVDAAGNLLACLDIPRIPELIQGNIRNDRIRDVWENRYEVFRTDYRKKGKCADCPHYPHCAGDSFHTWDFEKNEPGLCMKGILFPDGEK
ncbi:MAG: radical SAM protein [Lachnospiraceae bacterium]|nr:radical SAM protein [Lachnospiraceae bacterium]